MKKIFKALIIIVLVLLVIYGVQDINYHKTKHNSPALPAITEQREIQFYTKDNGEITVVFNTKPQIVFDTNQALRMIGVSHELDEFKDPNADSCIVEELKDIYGLEVSYLHVKSVSESYSKWRKINRG